MGSASFVTGEKCDLFKTHDRDAHQIIRNPEEGVKLVSVSKLPDAKILRNHVYRFDIFPRPAEYGPLELAKNFVTEMLKYIEHGAQSGGPGRDLACSGERL